MSLQTLLTALLGFINAYIIPLILAIGFFVFVINVVRYFVISSADSESRENAKNLALYSMAAFVLILSLWGIVNLLVGGVFGTSSTITDPCFKDSVADYISRDSSAPCTDTRPPSRPANIAEPETSPFINGAQ